MGITEHMATHHYDAGYDDLEAADGYTREIHDEATHEGDHSHLSPGGLRVAHIHIGDKVIEHPKDIK